MTMYEYVLKLYTVEKGAIVTKTEDENIFLATYFRKKEDNLKLYTSFVCTNGEILLTYCPETGELNKYDFIDEKWEYYSWTFSQKERYTELLNNYNFNEFYNNFKGWIIE